MKKYFLYIILGITIFLNACSDDNSSPSPIPNDSSKPQALKDGITIISDDSLAFVLFAPEKNTVHLIGDFNNWTASDKYKMYKDGDRFWIKIGELDKTKEYVCQYLIDDKIRIADPYANKISDPDNDQYITDDIYPDLITYPVGKTSEIAMVVSTKGDNYSWKVKDFKIQNPENLVIYEILIRDFTEKRTVKGIQEKLPYIKALGVDAIELMPFNEFEGNDSWGYNPIFYFATDKAYGTSRDYKEFIDECHANGIAVIMDMVLNHSYGGSPMVRMYQDEATYQPTANNPWYNQKSNFENPAAQWGYDFNHESIYTRQFVDSVCSYWMNEYKIDGFRFDFTKGFSNTHYPDSGDDSWGSPYDAARITNLKRIYTEIKKRNPDALMICEHLSHNEEEKELSEAGIMLWGNINYGMNEATMGWTQQNGDGGWNSDIEWGSYIARGWTKPNLITYMESHDEERLMYKNEQYGKEYNGYNVKDIPTALKRSEAAAVILLSLPGPKMIWQFGELGYDYKLGSSMEDGRLDKKPIRWDYYENTNRKALYDVYSKMHTLRKANSAFSTSNYSTDMKEPFKFILLSSSDNSVCAMANFDVIPVTKTIDFGKVATWNDAFSNNQIITTGGATNVTLQPGEYRLYISN